MGWRSYEAYYPRSQPRAAKGGIKAQSRSGSFGSTWWAKRWIALLEGFGLGARLTRGRSYARGGQVLDIDIAAGLVTARVQGSQAQPYTVRIRVTPLSAAQWHGVGAVLARQAVFAAKLLAGEMPQDIEEAFRQAGQSLFPTSLGDLGTDCSCPDWSNPCKHIAAVYYLLGEEFDRDPFLLFSLRGLSREALVALLASAAPAEPAAAQPPAGGAEELAAPAEPLPTDALAFWTGGALPADLTGAVAAPAVTAAAMRRLGSFPFWRGQASPVETLTPVYVAATRRGLDVVAGVAPGDGQAAR